MSFERNYAIASPSKLKNLALVFQPTRRNPKPIAPCTLEFRRALSKNMKLLEVLISNGIAFI